MVVAACQDHPIVALSAPPGVREPTALALAALAVVAIGVAVHRERPRALRSAWSLAPDGRAAHTAAPKRAAPRVADDGWLGERIARLEETSPLWRDPVSHRMQILVTRVEGSAIRQHGYRADDELFYPASAIKPFVAVAALRELQRLREEDPSLTVDTPLYLCRVADARCALTHDASNLASGRITIRHELRKMLLVSNNVAFNRLYDLVGHHRLNDTFRHLGFDSVRLRHRFLGGPEGGRVSPPMVIGSVALPRRVSAFPVGSAPAKRTEIGDAYYDEAGELHRGPADFRFKNYASLYDMQRLLIGVAMPDLPGAPDLGLTDEHRELLLDAMTEDPRASENPEYPGAHHAIEHHKALFWGARRAVADLRCVSKSGRAYGFEIDNAFFRHEPSGRALFVTAAVYANPNRVINDNGYAYHLTRAFMEALGEELARAAFTDESDSPRRR